MRSFSTSSRAWALVTGIISTISMTLAEVSSISRRKALLTLLILRRKATTVREATGATRTKKTRMIRFLTAVMVIMMVRFMTMFRRLTNIWVERVSMASTSLMILD